MIEAVVRGCNDILGFGVVEKTAVGLVIISNQYCGNCLADEFVVLRCCGRVYFGVSYSEDGDQFAIVWCDAMCQFMRSGYLAVGEAYGFSARKFRAMLHMYFQLPSDKP